MNSVPPERIAVIGIGSLGLCWALSLERAGFNVVGVDSRSDHVGRINERQFTSHEPGVDRALKEAVQFRATADLGEAAIWAEMLFILVATPSLPDGSYDHSQIRSVAQQLKDLGALATPRHLVVSCTTWPGFCDEFAEEMAPWGWIVSYNPSFIAQGEILANMRRPDLVLIGERNTEAGELLTGIHERVCLSVPAIRRMKPISAEITKLSLNCFLTTKIAFANMVGDLALRCGAEPERILDAIGSDSRVGKRFLKFGFGYGGPCLPRDNRAFVSYARKVGAYSDLSSAVDSCNELHLHEQVKEFGMNRSLEDPSPFRFGPVAYKDGSTSIESSPRLALAVELARQGHSIILQDHPAVLAEVQNRFGSLFHGYESTRLEAP